ncbi:hypothetical protein ACA910_012343 [Epithemia clementina (nom. ined.)]
MIDTVVIDEEYQEPLGNSQNWIKKENMSWLAARGLDKKGDAPELNERVQMYVQQTNIPLPHQSSGSVKSVVDTDKIDFWVRQFLSCFSKVDQDLQSSEDSQEKPSWVTSSNVMSLLKLLDTVRGFGPLCNIWKGGTQEEGFLQYVKREMSMGLRNNWQQ